MFSEKILPYKLNETCLLAHFYNTFAETWHYGIKKNMAAYPNK